MYLIQLFYLFYQMRKYWPLVGAFYWGSLHVQAFLLTWSRIGHTWKEMKGNEMFYFK